MNHDRFVAGKTAEQLWSLATRIVPPSSDLDESQRQKMLDIVEEAFRVRPAALRQQVKIFLGVIDLLSRLRGLRAFRHLSPARQDRVLASLDRSPIQAIRQGFWGLKAILLMGYYGRTEAGESIGYRPLLRGGGLVATQEPR